MSGGVDSSVAAHLLQQKGYEVVGVFMKNWDSLDETGVCSSEVDRRDAALVCKQLQIPFHEVNFCTEYWLNVFERMLHGYEHGDTVNPDVLCNREIKFKRFFDYAVNQLGADHVATGHYARLQQAVGGNQKRLLTSADVEKDQTYFLCMVPGLALNRWLFPVGDLRKEQVRQYARQLGLHTANKRSSRGICFIGKRDFGGFLSQYINTSAGDFVSVEDGTVLGRHSGAALFTVGQHARLPGKKHRYYVSGVDVRNNRVLVAPGRFHPSLFAQQLFVRVADLSWISAGGPDGGTVDADGQLSLRVKFRVRYRTPLADGTLRLPVRPSTSEHAVVIADKPVMAVAPGQVLALYDESGTCCLGGAPVARAEPGLQSPTASFSQHLQTTLTSQSSFVH